MAQNVAATEPADEPGDDGGTGRLTALSSTTMLVEIWSDVVCPWCYIGKRRFEEALASFPGRDDVTVVYRAFQLDPTAPPGVVTSVREVYDRKFGPDQAEQLIDRVTTMAAEAGLDVHLERAQRANTLLAHQVLWLAEQQGHQEAMKERLLRAYFTEGRNIGDPDVLAELAAEVGLDHDQVVAALADGRGRAEVAAQIEEAARPRHRRRADLRVRPTVVGARRAGPGDVPAGAGAGRRAGGRGVRARVTGLHVERQGAGPPVVLVHGFTQTGRSWGPIAADLRRDHEVVLVDAPGHGGSAAVRTDLTAGAALLGAAGGRATYVGYSMGGRLALHLALDQPDQVDALVLLGATAGIEDEQERAARRRGDEGWASDLERDGLDPFLERWLAQPLFANLPADAADLDDRRRNTVEGLASSLRLAGTGSQAPRWSDLPGLRMPVLVLAGERDERFAALGRRMARAIGANAAFAVVAGAGHAAHREQPDAFLAVLRAFLAAQRLTK